MKWQNELTQKFKIEYPIIQAPMLGVTTPEMVAAISNEGGLGSLPVGGLSPAITHDLIKRTRNLTNKTFAVNLFANSLPEKDHPQTFLEMQNLLAEFAEENKINYKKVSIESIPFHSYKDQIDIILEERIPVVSFTFGIPDDKTIEKLKAHDVILIGTATCLQEARILDSKGIDIITAQGIEAGGHRGTFIESENLPLVGSMALIPQVADAIKKPVVAAGGILDGRGIKAALILGAQGVQLGSAFIASDESAATPAYKFRLQNADDTATVLTRTVSGRWARGFENKLMQAVEQSKLEISPYPFQIALTSSFREYGQKQDDENFMVMWAGQFSRKAMKKSTSEIFKRLIEQTEAI